MKKGILIVLAFAFGVGSTIGFELLLPYFVSETGELLIPAIITPPKERPLQKYALSNLAQITPASSIIASTDTLQETPDYTSYLYQMEIRGKTMTGQLTLPTQTTFSTNYPVIVMLRGYVPVEEYVTGTGTKNAAAAFAKAGYITVAPDFFGYGQSDPEPADTWQARFEKPILVADIIESLQKSGIMLSQAQTITSSAIGIWAHSNGGQIALSTLIGYDYKFPTTLWAPVTAPFPYSVLFFSDELSDEGKSQRKWISIFEEDYDSLNFSLTQYLSKLQAPLQLHHGETDDAALIAWSDEFVEKLKDQNETATITYFRYPNTDHNLQPNWNIAISRDLSFFAKYLPLP